MKRYLGLAILLMAWMGWVVMGMVEMVHASVTTNTEITENITKDGVIDLIWDFDAATSTTGAISVRTKFPVQGTLVKAVHIPDYAAPIATTAELTVRPVSEYRGRWYEGSAVDVRVVTYNTNALTEIPCWPAANVMLTTETQFELTGATTEAGEGARGRLWFTLIPQVELEE